MLPILIAQSILISNLTENNIQKWFNCSLFLLLPFSFRLFLFLSISLSVYFSFCLFLSVYFSLYSLYTPSHVKTKSPLLKFSYFLFSFHLNANNSQLRIFSVYLSLIVKALVSLEYHISGFNQNKLKSKKLKIIFFHFFWSSLLSVLKTFHNFPEKQCSIHG